MYCDKCVGSYCLPSSSNQLLYYFLSHVSLIEFFKKMKKWQEMAQLPSSFQQKIEALERKFEVASIIYEKYRKVFRQLFNVNEDKPEASAPSRHRGRKPHQ